MGRMIRRRLLTLTLATAVTLQSTTVLAGSDDEARAKVLFDEARDLAKANKWAEACEKLLQSKRLSPRMLTTYRLADCHERIGKTASAHAGFIEAADLAKATGDSTKQQDALDRAKKVEGKLARVTLALPPDEPSITIKIDDVAIAPALVREKIPLDPGEHTLVASASGKKPREVTFEVPPGPSVTSVSVPPLEAEGKTTETKTSSDPTPPPVDDTKPPPSSGSGLKTVGFIALGVGAVGLGVGTALGLSAKSLDGDAEKLCTSRGCTAEGKQLNDDARSRGNLATVVFTAGALIAVTGVVLIIAAPSSTSTTTARVSPWVGAGGGGLTLVGSF